MKEFEILGDVIERTIKAGGFKMEEDICAEPNCEEYINEEWEINDNKEKICLYCCEKLSDEYREHQEAYQEGVRGDY